MPEILRDRIEHLVEPARDDTHLPAARVHRGDELPDPGREPHAGVGVTEDALGRAAQGRDALGEAFGEVELAAHRPLGHLGDLFAGPRGVGEELNDLVLDGRGIAVENDEWGNAHSPSLEIGLSV